MDVSTTDTYMVITIYLLLIILLNQAWSQDTKVPPIQMEEVVESQPERKSGLVFLDLISWQQEGEIKSGSEKSPIIITNKGVCAGGAYGHETATYRTFVDGCFVYASGNAGAVKNTITYNQSDVSAYGLKASFGAGRFVSSAKAEIGFKVPVMYINQSFTEPRSSTLTDPQSVMLMMSLYSRWPFGKWFVQTEFSKFVGNDLVLFSVGGGHSF